MRKSGRRLFDNDFKRAQVNIPQGPFRNPAVRLEAAMFPIVGGEMLDRHRYIFGGAPRASAAPI